MHTLKQVMEDAAKWKEVVDLATKYFPGLVTQSTGSQLCPCHCGKLLFENSITIRRVS